MAGVGVSTLFIFSIQDSQMIFLLLKKKNQRKDTPFLVTGGHQNWLKLKKSLTGALSSLESDDST